MPGEHGAQIVLRECAAHDRVKREGALVGEVVRVQEVADGPNGICSATEVKVRWDDGEEVNLNPMAPRGDPDSPVGVVFWDPPAMDSEGTTGDREQAQMGSVAAVVTAGTTPQGVAGDILSAAAAAAAAAPGSSDGADSVVAAATAAAAVALAGVAGSQ